MSRSSYGRSQASDLETRIGLAAGGAIALFLLLLLIKLLLPWLLLAGGLAIGLWGWHRYQRYQQMLHQLFYEQIQAHQGRISVLEFAMAAQLTGPQARSFLDARARDFFADFEPTEAGDVLYTFRLSENFSTQKL